MTAITWQQREIKIFGKPVKEPRLTMWYGEEYSYSGVIWKKKTIPTLLQGMMAELSQFSGFEFNSVLANFYRHGQDSMGWHRDNEKEINSDLIASVSLGAPRRFGFRRRMSKEAEYLNLESGSLLLMHHFQHDWEHCIPKTRKQVGERLNLTFRQITVR